MREQKMPSDFLPVPKDFVDNEPPKKPEKMEVVFGTEFCGQQLLCPVCKDTYLHFAKPQFVDGRDDYKASKHVRGSAISVDCACENGGHVSRLMIGFHKGFTLIWFEALPKNCEFEAAD